MVMTLWEMGIGQTLLPILTMTLWTTLATGPMWLASWRGRVTSEFAYAMASVPFSLTI